MEETDEEIWKPITDFLNINTSCISDNCSDK